MYFYSEEEFKKLFELFSITVKDGIFKCLKKIEEEKQKPEWLRLGGAIDDYPYVSYDKNGMPAFYTRPTLLFKEPRDYDDLFTFNNEESKIKYKELVGYIDLENYILSNSVLTKSLMFGSLDKKIIWILRSFISRYLYINSEILFEEKKFLLTFNEIISYYYLKQLPITLCIPIINTTITTVAEDEKIEIGINCFITKMNNNFQLSRASIHSLNSSVHKNVIAKATHALMLSNLVIKQDEPPSVLGQVNQFYFGKDFPQKRTIDNFFIAIKLATKEKTGYGQILTCPIGWGHNFVGALQALEGYTIKEYPSEFDNFGWWKDPLTLDKETMEKVINIFKMLEMNKSQKMNIAVNRYNL